MLSLSQNYRFKQDIERYQTAIKNTDREDIQKELAQLISKLVLTVRSLDSHHYEMVLTRQKNSSIEDIREEILYIRKKIEKIIKDLNQA